MSTSGEFSPDQVLFHRDGLLAVNKPVGCPVHAGDQHQSGVVERVRDWVHFHPGTLDIRAGKTPMAVHHLDREASGVLLLALRRPVARQVQQGFDANLIERRLITVVGGPMEPLGELRGKVRTRTSGGPSALRDSKLNYRRICGDERMSLLEVTPGPSRRHLVRALLASTGRPVCGDLRYGKPKPGRQFLERYELEHLILHSAEVILPKPVLGTEHSITAPLPPSIVHLAKEKGWSDDPAYRSLVEELGIMSPPES